MRTFLRLKNRTTRKLPDEFRDDDHVRYADGLVAAMLQRFSHAGDTVFDPFAGFGTTLLVAEAMGRAAYGIEVHARRARYIRSQLQHPERLIHGDSRKLQTYDLPPLDFVMTSPPFTEQRDPDDPFTNYTAPRASYEAYLADMAAIFAQIRDRMQPNAHAVLEVSNLKSEHGVTTLAWDAARAVGAVLRFEGEIVVGWDHYGYGYDHSYCLVFRRDA